MNKRTLRLVVPLLCSALAGSGLYAPAAQAAFIGTGSVLHGGADVVAAVGEATAAMRQGLVTTLVEHGVDAGFAEQRVAALTDAQVVELNGRIDELPAGGDLLGVVAFIFIVLVITDALGVTDVFTFVNKPRN
jgi:hypothetical protein